VLFPSGDGDGVPGMTAPPVSGDPFGEFGAFAMSGMQGNDEKSGRLVLSDADRVREALLASRIAVDCGRSRIRGPQLTMRRGRLTIRGGWLVVMPDFI
jgi:hypothetical protein